VDNGVNTTDERDDQKLTVSNLLGSTDNRNNVEMLSITNTPIYIYIHTYIKYNGKKCKATPVTSRGGL
jgi:hypothetical protein